MRPRTELLFLPGGIGSLPDTLVSRGRAGVKIFFFLVYYGIPYSAGRVAGAIHLRLPVPVWLVSGVAAQNSDPKNFHKEAKGAYLHKICRFTHNGSFTARPCSQ